MRSAALSFLWLAAVLAPSPGAHASVAPPERWKSTIEQVAPAIVMLRVTMPRAFDDQPAGYQTATGFVVDKERGLILTNRHVVTPGPVVAEAVFLDNEEVPVRAVYRDPVHDFGLFQFDPDDVRFMKVVELPLAPERARVGSDIRVIGNDAGEKLSILAGILARLDRRAPPYGQSSYNDFNTFYYQAASGTSGGSSGSPVIDVEGHVVALNAGASRTAASSFFLPLQRVVRALRLVQQGKPVTRGTLQTIFVHRPYDELRRLGLRQETEARVRKEFSEGNGLLMVEEVVPGGPSAGVLEPGDVLLRINGSPVDSFLPLETALDDGVGQRIQLDVERGGVPLSLELEVGDLHAITPSAYLEAAGGVFNSLSYQMARNYSLPVRGVHVTEPGYALSRAGIQRGSVLTRFGSQPIQSLEDLERAWASQPDGSRIPVRYFRVETPKRERVAIVEIDRAWFPMRRCSEEIAGRWTCVESQPAPPATALAPRETEFPDYRDPVLQAVTPSLVAVEFHIPYPVDGVHAMRFQGVGLVVDSERGLVVVDRETVPIALGDITLRFASSIQVPGELVYLHPEHNLAVLRYDPASVGSTPVQSADLRPGAVDIGDDVWLVGLSARERPLLHRTTLSRLEPIELPLLRTPRFRETNLDVFAVADGIPTIGGVLTDAKGRIVALWASFSQGSGKNVESFVRGIPIERVIEIVEPLRRGEPVKWHSLGVEWSAIPLADARDRGLPEEAAQQLQKIGRERRQVLSVAARAAGSPASKLLQDGDLLFAVEGKPAIRFADVERASQRDTVRLSVFRDGKPLELEVPTEVLPGTGTERAVVWAGAVLQRPPRAIELQRGIEGRGVYVSFYFYGSPANRYRLGPTRRILSVDGKATPDLDAFVAAVRGKRNRDPVRLQVQDLESKVSVVTLKTDLDYWPTYELRRGERGWERTEPFEVQEELAGGGASDETSDAAVPVTEGAAPTSPLPASRAGAAVIETQSGEPGRTSPAAADSSGPVPNVPVPSAPAASAAGTAPPE